MSKTLLTPIIVGLLLLGCETPNSDIALSNKTVLLKAQLELGADGEVMVIAHRACWRETAENSISAINACIHMGVDMIEIDVRETKDGRLVLIHDESVDRTTNGAGAVQDLTWNQISRLKLKEFDGGAGAAITEETVPTLEQALFAASGKILINLDIKADLYEKSLRIAEELGVVDQIVFKMAANADDIALKQAGFHGKTYFMPIIRECIAGSPKLCWPILSETVADFSEFNPIAFEVVYHSDEYLLEGIGAIGSSGARVWVNTLGARYAAGREDEKAILDPDENWGFLISHGVNMLQTDRPRELINYLKTNESKLAASQ
ncbi:MAG: glycerophosphodiester phosphodiesterase family protein [Xanthomonadales bacterium]|jgi:glycerophosphoryl diester phosphodiesterase|nr:glycerophosphodiester phosphodiesterase family protein [Xanthomonadales bacterium]